MSTSLISFRLALGVIVFVVVAFDSPTATGFTLNLTGEEDIIDKMRMAGVSDEILRNAEEAVAEFNEENQKQSDLMKSLGRINHSMPDELNNSEYEQVRFVSISIKLIIIIGHLIALSMSGTLVIAWWKCRTSCKKCCVHSQTDDEDDSSPLTQDEEIDGVVTLRTSDS